MQIGRELANELRISLTRRKRRRRAARHERREIRWIFGEMHEPSLRKVSREHDLVIVDHFGMLRAPWNDDGTPSVGQRDEYGAGTGVRDHGA